MVYQNSIGKMKNTLFSKINYQYVVIIVLLLVTSTIQSPQNYVCPDGCECNETDFSARCNNLEDLLNNLKGKQHETRHHFMPIKSLDLSNNQLTKLTNQLELLVNLTELNLSHNLLTQVHKLNFDNLEKLDLSHNRITSAKLKKLPKNVVHLSLAYNEITYLPVDFMKMKKLRSVELVGNPLNCTCNTLHVRNWLTLQHVWSDNHINCASPLKVKGHPWLSVRQSDICIEPSSTTTQRSKYNWENYEDDNEIMMGDQPQTEDDSNNDDNLSSQKEDEEENNGNNFWEDGGKVEEDKPKSDPNELEKDEDGLILVSENLLEEEEEKGKEKEPEEDEGSGKEAMNSQILNEGSEAPIEGSTADDYESGSGAFESDMNSSNKSIGIFTDEVIETAQHKQKDVSPNPPQNLTPAEEVSKASSEDNSGTYILLGILAICLVSLMIFVALKNKKEKKKNRRYDVEKNIATELQDMDKSLLGKPLEKNGNGKAEHIPLINYPVQSEDEPKTNSSFSPPEIIEPNESPVNKKNQRNLNNSVPNGNSHIEPTHQSPKTESLPNQSDDEFHPAVDNPEDEHSLNVSPEPPKRYSPIYTSQSPRSDRYSPVYSPETGRVKIKLTETPKPKTPQIVTRSRSRTGDYVNTPN